MAAFCILQCTKNGVIRNPNNEKAAGKAGGPSKMFGK
jgi:hypothetical protein